MLAAQGGHTETIKALIDAGADVNLINFVSSYDAGAEDNLKGDDSQFISMCGSSIVLFHCSS